MDFLTVVLIFALGFGVGNIEKMAREKEEKLEDKRLKKYEKLKDDNCKEMISDLLYDELHFIYGKGPSLGTKNLMQPCVCPYSGKQERIDKIRKRLKSVIDKK